MATNVCTCTNTISLIPIATFCILIQNDFADTALVAAVDKGHIMIVDILVKAGANMNYKNKVRQAICH